MLNRKSWLRSKSLAILLLVVGSLSISRPASAQKAEVIARLDRLVRHVRRIAAKRSFDRSRLYGVSRNLAAFADRWPALRDRLPDESIADAGFPSAAARGPISTPTLQISRFGGFTQSQTSTAWCGSSVITFFNDTGSEAKTIAALGGITAIGFATSSNQGHAFAYQGAPPAGINLDQSILGSPTVACASAAQFFYAAIGLDTLNDAVGVAFAGSTDGGHSFSSPIVAMAKDASTHLIDHDWLAVDTIHSALYIAYADTDYSGLLCGVDPASASPIPRYAVELVASTDGGATWSSTPTIIEQVCADSISPWAMVMGPQIAIGPAGEIYAAYEAAGENGGVITARAIKVARSTDGGTTFSSPVVVAAVTPVGDGADLQGFVRANEFPSIAIGKSKKDAGFIYLAWDDGGNPVADNFTTTGTYAFADIKTSVSHDGGATWKSPLRVNNNIKSGSTGLTDQFEPAIAADTKGNLAICFYDRRRDPNNFQIDRECAKSSDGGSTWINRKITAAVFPTEVGQDLLVAPDYMGDFDTVATDATGQKAGFLDSYASNASGHPSVMVDQP